jgi:hypothetical protein
VKTLTRGQIAVLTAAVLPMIGAGGLGAWGTYANITSVFHRTGTAAGVVAAGEGATLVLALVLVGLTMLGQPSPLAVRAGLWLLPAAAAVTGAVVAPGARDAVVFAITPMAMTVSAEGLGLLARRIVIRTTGVDAEAQRRNAATLRKIAYHRARAERHPWKWVRKYSALRAWRLMGRAGDGDTQLGSGLVQVQRERLTEGANTALTAMLGSGRELPPAVFAELATAEANPIANIAPVAANTAGDQVANKAITSPNPQTAEPTMAELVREHVANTLDNRTAVDNVMAALPTANRASVAAAVRRERRNTQGYA